MAITTQDAPVPEDHNNIKMKIARVISAALNGIGAVLLLLTLYLRVLPGVWGRVLGLMVFAAAAALCILRPGRFCTSREKEFEGGVHCFGLEIALLATLFAMVIDALHNQTYPNLMEIFLWGAALGFAVGAAIIRASGKYRSGDNYLVLIGLMLLSFGALAQVNQLLDFAPTMAYSLTVDKTETDTGSEGDWFYRCYVTMPSGEQEQFEIPREQFQQLEAGEKITIVSHEGALGFEYLTIDWDE